ncbi:MAG: prephenate dehydrogenase [Candidatus Omnitrophota bacterium]
MNGKRIFFRKVTIVGVGLIGGSLGMAIKKNGLAKEVMGLARRHGPLVTAIRGGAIDKISHDYKKAVDGSDLVIFATPVKTIMELFPKVGCFLKRGCLVTDVGSIKEEIVRAAHKSLPPYVNFVGSHPVAGSEKSGNLFANADLFKDSLCVVTPTDKTNRAAVDTIKTLWTKCGALVKTLSPQEHDQILAYVSHVPHLLAYSLMDAIPEKYLDYASSGLKDTTRVASSDPKMWNDICMANSRNILRTLDSVVKQISVLRKAITSRKEQDLMERFKESKRKRDGIN